MKILEITDKKIWNDFIGAQKYAQFLQSWQWGEFHEKMGRKVWRLAVMDVAVDNTPPSPPLPREGGNDAINRVSQTEAEIVLAAQIIKYRLPFGQNYLYAPRGPIFKSKKREALKLFFEEIEKLAAREKSMFIKIEPKEELEIFKGMKIRLNKVNSVQPANEWLLDLEKNEDELLKEMQQKTRYNVRLADKKGLAARFLGSNMEKQSDETAAKSLSSDWEKNIDDFWRLISLTYNRKEIKTHTRDYYKQILAMGNQTIKLWVVPYQGNVICANIMSYFGDTATYMHGGADYHYRDLMAPYAMQWACIKHAKREGFKYYNFGGVIGKDEIKSSWEGITRFKKGFGGFELNYSGTYEAPLNKWRYKTYRLVRRFR